MKFIKYALLLTLAGALIGCGGHGFEGEYESKAGSSNAFVDAFANSAGISQKIIIGSDYMESDGERHSFEEIFVRESGEEKYLVFKDGEDEVAWKIVDDNTLMQGN
ncbi:MAG: hypothetical protein OIF35_02760, partial [Cellvibrionaceae bacterium]|nr:hypothetical protein [Cellvibrionaceae bacterium]